MEDKKLDTLSEELIKIINNRSNPFEKIKVLIPSYSLKSYFKTYWLKKSKDNVLMNVYFYTVDDLLVEFACDDKQILSSDLIILYILEELSSNLSDYNELNKYYYINETINHNKLYDLSKMLSDLYIEYEDDLFDYNSTNIYTSDEEKLFNKITLQASNNQAKQNKIFTRKEIIDEHNFHSGTFVSFGFNQYTKLEERLINKLNISDEHNLMLSNNKDIKSLKIITAPSKIREIEGIHTEICKILLNNNVTYSDILVLCPKVTEYKTIIRQVFHQDNINYPSITRSINQEANIPTNITNVLIKLKDIVKKEYYSSLDFIELISNPIIKKNRGITDEDIKIIKEILVNLNIKRENTNSNTIKDFTYLKTRLLLNQVLDINILDHNLTCISDKCYIPFDSIGLTDSIVCSIVDTIDDLNNIIEFYKSYNNKVDIDKFREQLNCWFSNAHSNGEEKNTNYELIINDLDNYKNIVRSNLSIDILFDYLKDRSLTKAGINDNYFLNGITFANFDYKALLEAKYIFLIGCDNNSLNTNLSLSELDIRDHTRRKFEYKARFENAFVLQTSLAKEKAFISYVREDLKTEEEIYPSNLIDNVIYEKEGLNSLKEYKDKYKNDIDNYEEIPLDETRDSNLLFTKREEINKKYFDELKKIKIDNDNIADTNELSNNTTNTNSISNEKIIEVKLKDLRDFLEEPYSFWISKLFGREDETDDFLNDEFEILDIDKLSSYSIVKDLVIENYNQEENANDKVKDKYTLINKLPLINESLKDKTFNDEIDKSKILIKDGYRVKLFDDLNVYDGKNKVNYLIKISNEILIKEDENNVNLSIIKVSKNNNKIEESKKFKDYLELYLYSLVYVISKGNNNTKYNIELDTGLKTQLPKKFEISYDTALNNLVNIINKMNDSINDLKYFKYDKAFELDNDGNVKKFNYNNYSDTYTLYENSGPWAYFKFKDLVNKHNINGLTYGKLDFKDAKDECDKVISEYKKFYDENICGSKAGE